MKLLWIHLLYIATPLIKILPLSIKNIIHNWIKNIFIRESIFDYLNDHEDVGFFEGFIIGADERQALWDDCDRMMNSVKKTDMIQKISGIHKINSEEYEEIYKENLFEKKSKLIEVLKSRDQVIDYLSKRILAKRPILYEELKTLYDITKETSSSN